MYAKKRKERAWDKPRDTRRQRVDETLLTQSSETKYFDADKSSSTLATVSADWPLGARQDPSPFNCLCAPQLGNDINNRIGKKITVMKVTVRGQVFVDALTAAQQSIPQVFRIILLVNKNCNGAQPTPSEVISSANANNMIYGYSNLSFFGKYRILKDKTFTLTPQNSVGDTTTNETAPVVQRFKLTHKFAKPLVVTFNTNTGAVADIVQNSLHIIAGYNTSSPAANISYKSRVVYKDT